MRIYRAILFLRKITIETNETKNRLEFSKKDLFVNVTILLLFFHYHYAVTILIFINLYEHMYTIKGGIN